jgi:cell cycle sensor histidine kinase DivJ
MPVNDLASVLAVPVETPAQRRAFLRVQVAKAGLGAVLGLLFIALVGRPDLLEGVALAALLTPAIFAGLSLTAIPLAVLEQAGLAGFALLIGYLAALTGGITSPLVVWLVLVPAEAALAGGRAAVVRAALISGLALLGVAGLQAAALLPVSRLTLALSQAYLCSMLAALVQAALIAAAAQDRQRAADAAAAEGALLYRFLADNAMDLITRHGADGRVRFASPASLTLLGLTRQELEGETFMSLAHPADIDAVQAALIEASYFGRAGTAEARLRHKDGHHVWAEIRCRPVESRTGAPAEIVAVTRGIAERKRQEQALVEARDAALAASRAKSRFLANMSHELRTPLNAIIGFSEVTMREMFGAIGPRYQEYARLIHESGTHLLDLINSVLDMSKIEAGKFALSEEVFNLEEVAESALRVLKIPAERAVVLLRLEIAAGARQIYADRRAVKQVLVNLLSNGVKYTPAGGEVAVIARIGADRAVEISVRDTGTGIAPADLERLGRPFEQVETAAVRAKEGTGLGLALVKSLVGLHGGEARISSVLGEGTTVTVRLPHAAVRIAGGKVIPFKAAS